MLSVWFSHIHTTQNSTYFDQRSESQTQAWCCAAQLHIHRTRQKLTLKWLESTVLSSVNVRQRRFRRFSELERGAELGPVFHRKVSCIWSFDRRASFTVLWRISVFVTWLSLILTLCFVGKRRMSSLFTKTVTMQHCKDITKSKYSQMKMFSLTKPCFLYNYSHCSQTFSPLHWQIIPKHWYLAGF